MTANETITFACPACGSTLSIPAQLAGITGPCPTCQTVIRAPYPVSAQASSPQQVESSIPAAAPAPASAAPSSFKPPVPSEVFRQRGDYKPEPRQLPARSGQMEQVINKQIPDNRDTVIPAGQSHRIRKLFRILIPLVFLLVAAGIVIGVGIFLKQQKAPDPPVKPRQNSVLPILPAAPAAPDTISAPPVLEGKAPLPDTGAAEPKAAEPKAAEPKAAEPKAAVSESPTPPSAGITTIKVLEQFLAAKSLQERLPLVETNLPESELSGTLLDKALPQVSRIDTDFQDTNQIERVTDVFYNVDFTLENGTVSPQTILVRVRGDAAPKVVVAPILDLLGGRLKNYAKAPSSQMGTFQAIISAGAFCYDESVPNRDKKFTLMLLSRDNTKEIARAFFGKRSRIGEMLGNAYSGLSYGQAKACTVTLRWNTEEDPAKPYLEVFSIKSLDWNP